MSTQVRDCWPTTQPLVCPLSKPQGAAGSSEEGGASGGSSAAAGPTSFANLRQMAGLPQAAGQAQQGRKRAGATLVSRLVAPAHRAGKEPGPAGDAAAAAVAVLAAGGRKAK